MYLYELVKNLQMNLYFREMLVLFEDTGMSDEFFQSPIIFYYKILVDLEKILFSLVVFSYMPDISHLLSKF